MDVVIWLCFVFVCIYIFYDYLKTLKKQNIFGLNVYSDSTKDIDLGSGLTTEDMTNTYVSNNNQYKLILSNINNCSESKYTVEIKEFLKPKTIYKIIIRFKSNNQILFVTNQSYKNLDHVKMRAKEWGEILGTEVLFKEQEL